MQKKMEAELPDFFTEVKKFSDAGENRRVLIDSNYWAGPSLIPKFWQRSRVNEWKKYQNSAHRKNDIKTAKYGITFPIVNLFYQFQRLANAYFLFMVILQCIDIISSGKDFSSFWSIITCNLPTDSPNSSMGRHRS